MELKEFAKKIDGKEYGYQIFSDEEIQIAKDNGFIIVYGMSDDLMEFEGVMRDEGGCFDGGEVYFNRDLVCCDDDEKDMFPNCIKALWYKGKDKEGNTIAWTYETVIPHETFMIYEDGEPYCRGIVFHVDELK